MIVAGVDEAGRGPLAGPVVAAAVILPDHYDLPGLTDSKKLSAARRQKLFVQIKASARSFSVAQASVAEIDQLNILQATLLAMQRAVQGLAVVADRVDVDGNRLPALPMHARAIIGGDLTVPSISAASILAKVTRDRLMVALDELFPGYGLAQHKGYGTKQHMIALKALGPCACHRRSFSPISTMQASIA
jgi:ribonuclease HII